MGTPGSVLHIRLPKTDHERLKEFCAQKFPGLQASLVVRVLLLDQLAKNDDELARVILANITGKSSGSKPPTNRLGANARGQRPN